MNALRNVAGNVRIYGRKLGTQPRHFLSKVLIFTFYLTNFGNVVGNRNVAVGVNRNLVKLQVQVYEKTFGIFWSSGYSP